MTAWAAVAGSATAWLLVLVVGTGAGYGTVLAWSRWGGRLPVPAPAVAAVGRLLGPTEVLQGAGASDAEVENHRPSAPDLDDDVEDLNPPPHPVVVAVAAPPSEAVLTSVDAAAEERDAADPSDDAHDGPSAALQEADEVEHEKRGPVRALPRTEALTELSKVLGLEYDDAAALLDHGLWGFENFDEWSRSMRGHDRPDDISESAWEKVLQVDWRVLAPAVDAHREKHAAMQRLEELWGVGPDEAEALYGAGYRDLPSIRKVSTDALAKVPGIGAARAFQIRAAAHGLAPTR